MEVKKQPTKLSRYVDPTGEFTNRTLKMSEWYVRHKILLRRILISILSLWSVATIGTGLFVFGDYLIFGYADREAMIEDMSQSYINFTQMKAFYRPKELAVKTPVSLPGTEGRYNFVVEVANPNDRWIAEVLYSFSYGNGKTENAVASIFPMQEIPLVILGHEESVRPKNIRFTLDSITWRRIDPHEIFDPVNFIEQRFQFEVDSFEFVPADYNRGIVSHVVSFDLTNNSLYSYWEPSFYVLFINHGQLIGIDKIIVEQFRAGEVREIKINSTADQLRVTEVEVVPSIDLFDKTVYMPLSL